MRMLSLVKKVSEELRNPNVLTAASLVLFAGALYFTAKAVKPVSAVIEDAKAGNITKTEAAKKIVTEPAVIGAVACTTGSVACNIASRKASEKIIGDLASAYNMSQALNVAKDEKIKELVGEEQAKEITQKISEEASASKTEEGITEPTDAIVITNHGNILFRDYDSGRYFRASKDFVNLCVQGIRNELNSEDYACLNDLYCLIGLDNTGHGAEVGWTSENRDDIRAIYEAGTSPWDEPCFVVKFIPAPWIEYDKYA